MNFRMIQAVINCFERSTVERIEENSNVSRFLFLFLLLLTLYTALIYNTTLVRLLTQFTTIIQLQITNNYRDNYLQR